MHINSIIAPPAISQIAVAGIRKVKEKDGPGPVMVSDTLCPAVQYVRSKDGVMEESVNRELNITRS